jgi:MarR family transcriptional regulator, lower aerobic nicotinate degradation pathway regulator
MNLILGCGILNALMSDDRSFSPVLQQILNFLLNKAAEGSNRHVEVVTAPHGLTIKQYGMLVLLQAEGPQPQIVLSQKVGLDRTSVMKTVDMLEERGLVRRDPHPTDRRKYNVTLTDAGENLLTQTLAEVQRAGQEFFKDLSEGEQAQLHALLVRLTQPR